MRYLVALAFCLLLASPQAHACREPSGETLFFEAVPDPQPDADVIAKVSLSDVRGGAATAEVMQVLKTSDARVRQGDNIAMKFGYTSCGPHPKNGDEGTIIAKVGADSNGRPVLCPYTRRRFDDGRITLRDMSEYGCPDSDYFKTKCMFSNVKFPEEMLVYAVGGAKGRELNFQIDQSGSIARQFDVSVNSPSRPVALILRAFEPTIWNIGWTEGTKIVAVFVSGYHRQAVAGLDSAVPVLNSSRDNSGGCGFYYGTQDNEINRISLQLFGQLAYPRFPEDKNGTIVIGEPLNSGTRLITSTAVTPSSFYDKSAPLAGRAGLDEAVAKGLLRPATRADVDAWVAAVAANPDKGIPNWSKPDTWHDAYVVLKEFTFPPRLSAPTFFIPKGVPLPKGNPGGSRVYDFDSLRFWCFTPGCPHAGQKLPQTR